MTASQYVDVTAKTRLCECGHPAAQHDEDGEGECKVGGCRCEAMEPAEEIADESNERLA